MARSLTEDISYEIEAQDLGRSRLWRPARRRERLVSTEGGTPTSSVSAPIAAGATQSLVRVGLALVGSDALCFAGALVLSYVMRFGPTSPAPTEVGLAGGALALWVGAFGAFGLYRPDLLSAPEELRRTISAASVGTVLVIVEAFWSHSSPSRTWIGLTWTFAIVFELGTRRVWRWYQARLRMSGRLSLRTLVVGTGGDATKLARSLSESRNGFAPVGFVATSSSMSSPGQWPTVQSPVVGSIDDLEQLIREHAVQCLFIASQSLSSEEMLRLSQVARREGVEVRISVNIPQTLTSRVTVQQVGGTMALSLRAVRLSGSQAALKRSFDVLLATLGLLISLPLWFLIGIAIRVTSPGSILFRQERVTKGGRRFTIYKFRTMRDGAAHGGRTIDPSAPFFKMDDDPRVTRVGALLRRWSLDELPQLLNVLRADMSLVGPRPLAAEQVDKITDFEQLYERQEVRAGLTGWWQINGRSDVTPEEALRLDSFYVENWSLALDLYILLKTIGSVVAGRGAY